MIARPDPTRLKFLHDARVYSESGTGRAIRERAKLTMADVARTLDVPLPTLYRWETGRNFPQGDRAIRWVMILRDLEEHMTEA